MTLLRAVMVIPASGWFACSVFTLPLMLPFKFANAGALASEAAIIAVVIAVFGTRRARCVACANELIVKVGTCFFIVFPVLIIINL